MCAFKHLKNVFILRNTDETFRLLTAPSSPATHFVVVVVVMTLPHSAKHNLYALAQKTKGKLLCECVCFWPPHNYTLWTQNRNKTTRAIYKLIWNKSSVSEQGKTIQGPVLRSEVKISKKCSTGPASVNIFNHRCNQLGKSAQVCPIYKCMYDTLKGWCYQHPSIVEHMQVCSSLCSEKLISPIKNKLSSSGMPNLRKWCKLKPTPKRAAGFFIIYNILTIIKSAYSFTLHKTLLLVCLTFWCCLSVGPAILVPRFTSKCDRFYPHAISRNPVCIWSQKRLALLSDPLTIRADGDAFPAIS